MVKYYLKDGQEIKVGDTVEIQKTVDTTLGKGTATVSVLVTQASLELLIKEGFVTKEDDEQTAEELLKALKPYIRRFARNNKLSFDDALAVLAAVLEMSPAAHIQMLLEVMTEVMNMGKSATSPTVFILSRGHNYKVCQTSLEGAKLVPKFYLRSDAERAYTLLKPFIDEIVNEK